MEITPQTVRSVIEKRFRFAQLPMTGTMAEFDLKPNDLLQLQILFNQTFNRYVEVKHSDSVYSLTDKLIAV